MWYSCDDIDVWQCHICRRVIVAPKRRTYQPGLLCNHDGCYVLMHAIDAEQAYKDYPETARADA